MLRVGNMRERTCQGWSRREMLQVGGVGVLGLSLVGALEAEAAGAVTRPKSCILIWLSGGPGQHETFDPKPEAPTDIRGPWGAIETNVSGIRIGALLPQLARQAHQYCLVRSLHHNNPNHATLPMMTGHPMVDSTFGAVTTYLNRGFASALPPYVHLGARLDVGAGRLGAAYNPVEIADPTRGTLTLPDFNLPATVSASRFERRRKLISALDDWHDRLDSSEALRGMDANYQRAVAMLSTQSVRDAFDLKREAGNLRARYGASIFGQSCLLARRLVEAGTRFVQIHWTERGGGNWDCHGTVFSGMIEMEQYLCPRFDQGLSALLADLQDRGLLQDTLVVAFGEFGRGPKVTREGGRDHWPYVFSTILAGGGAPAGSVVGSSDDQGGRPNSRPVSAEDFATTLYRLLGFNPTTDDRLRPFVRGEVIPELV